MNGDSTERNKTYGWARRHGLHDPYDFAITHEEHWGNKERLAELARQWERDRLRSRRERIKQQIEELRRELELVESGFQYIDEYPYD
ncbi:hypothetical protein ACFW2V_13745 [Streptomyces sp. NPDC058947]|uniref:hypothetical protein n=1 Tax=Streptomyces sp. NPDC058947 TaxID=3346675 RepID=UPI003684BB73